MTTEELEEKLEGGVETQTIEFKTAHEWNANLFAKDILSLSNVQDGGYIIIGVEDDTFKRVGVTAKQKETYKIDAMKDQMTVFADPHVNFSVEFPKDKNGMDFVVLKINQFEEIPVICRKDRQHAQAVAGAIYYRNKNRRVESAAVSNSYDMRDIIELATIKMMQRKTKLGFKVEKETRKKLDEELEGL